MHSRDINIEAIRGSGPGGQHRNKSFTGVRASHLPTGLRASATERRSYMQNLKMALRRLEKLVVDKTKKATPRIATKPTKASRRRTTENKKHRSRTKAERRKVASY